MFSYDPEEERPSETPDSLPSRESDDFSEMFADGGEESTRGHPDTEASADENGGAEGKGHRASYRPDSRDPDPRPVVLVVDDSSMARQMVCAAVAKLGYRAVEASNGAEAISKARHHRPSLIVLDIVMPGPSGLETLRDLRSDPRFKSTPVIMLTIESKRDAIQEAISQQVSDYLVKPVDMKELVKRIRKFMPAAQPTPDDAGS